MDGSKRVRAQVRTYQWAVCLLVWHVFCLFVCLTYRTITTCPELSFFIPVVQSILVLQMLAFTTPHLVSTVCNADAQKKWRGVKRSKLGCRSRVWPGLKSHFHEKDIRKMKKKGVFKKKYYVSSVTNKGRHTRNRNVRSAPFHRLGLDVV